MDYFIPKLVSLVNASILIKAVFLTSYFIFYNFASSTHSYIVLSILHLDYVFTGTTSPNQSGSMCNSNEVVLHTFIVVEPATLTGSLDPPYIFAYYVYFLYNTNQ